MSEKYSDTEEKELTPKQEQLIAALVAGNSIVVAAKATGIAEKTAHVWLKKPFFKQAYKDAKQTAFEDTLGKLRDGTSIALKTLLKHMTHEDTPPQVQVRAAQIWLEQSIQIHKIEDLEKNLAEIAAFVKEQRG
jgi:phage terminase small subunit